MLTDLQSSQNQIKTLSGLLPICANCKKIRDDGGYWQQLEKYVGDHSLAEFTHSLCPQCVKKLYPGVADKVAITLEKNESNLKPVKDKPLDYEKSTLVLQNMALLLQNNQLSAVKYMEKLKESLGESNFHDEIDQLEKQIRNIEFVEASQTLEKILKAVNALLNESANK